MTINKKPYKCVKSTINEVIKTTKPLTLFSTLQETKLVYQNDIDNFIKLAGNRVIDILMHTPVNYELWHKVDSFKQIHNGENCCIETKIVQITTPKVSQNIAIKRRIPSFIRTVTFDGFKLDLVFFNIQPYILSKYKENQRIVCQGKLVLDKNGKPTMTNPYITSRIQNINGCIAVYKLNQLEDSGINVEEMNIDNIFPIYHLVNGIKQNQITNLLKKIFNNDRFDFSSLDVCDNLFCNFLQNKETVPSTKDSLFKLHFPQSIKDISNNSLFLRKIAFLELFSYQYILSKAREQAKMEHGIVVSGDGKIREKFLQNLPFSLTDDQTKCLKEIYADQASDKKMLRLLQGDVGSGKTVVALMSALNAVECGCKVVIMAPTAILARQHFETVLKFCFGLCVSVELLTGETKQKARKDILTRMNLGHVNILVGTHTLFQAGLELPKNIGLFIIDEQHNFGVKQRVALVNKCGSADVLMMSATPIPRTMIMGLYGDISVSCIKSKPSGRLPIQTKVLSFNEKYQALVAGIKRKITAGEKIYWICPLVEESERFDYVDINTRAHELANVIDKSKIGILHGKMSQEKKDEMMVKFKNGEIQLLIATTVIEVGVDVPDATIIVIENSEKFGLAQLHQLRGRVGRGSKQSYCFLLYGNGITEFSKTRLKILEKYSDGFDIAEFDLKLRGSGTLFDKKQSGFKTMNFADFSRDKELISFLRKSNIAAFDKNIVEPILSMFHKNENENLIRC